MADLQGGTTIGGYTAIHSGLPTIYLKGTSIIVGGGSYYGATINGGAGITLNNSTANGETSIQMGTFSGGPQFHLVANGGASGAFHIYKGLYGAGTNMLTIDGSANIFSGNGTKVIDNNGALYYKGNDTDARYLGISNLAVGTRKLYRNDATDTAYWIEHAWINGQGWKLKGVNNVTDTQAGINNVIVDRAYNADNSNTVNNVNANMLSGYPFSLSGNLSATAFAPIYTLPISSSSSYDKLEIEIIGNQWVGNAGRITAFLTNRNGFVYRWKSEGVIDTGVIRIVAYSQSDGSVQVYLCASASSYVAGFIRITFNNGDTVTSKQLGAWSTTAPSGTLVLDTSSASYPQNMEQVFGVTTLNAGGGKTTLTPQNDGSLRASNSYGYIDIAPKNGSWAHFFTDRSGIYFNQTNLSANGNTMWHAGNDGSGSGLDADTIDGMQPATANTASTIVQRDGSGNFSAGTITATLSGNASAATNVLSPDGDRKASTKLPTTTPRAIRLDFVNASEVTGAGGNYAGLMTYAPWDGTSASTGDASYQLAFNSTATNGSGMPNLFLRNGIDSTWNGWYKILHTGNLLFTSANTANYLVQRDGSGNFSAGTITASSFVKSGGTSSQFLKADGSSDGNSYALASSIGNGTLTVNTSGTGLSGSGTFTANQSGNGTITITSNATNANTASAIVARDSSGGFNAGNVVLTGLTINGTLGMQGFSVNGIGSLNFYSGAAIGFDSYGNITANGTTSTNWTISGTTGNPIMQVDTHSSTSGSIPANGVWTKGPISVGGQKVPVMGDSGTGSNIMIQRWSNGTTYTVSGNSYSSAIDITWPVAFSGTPYLVAGWFGGTNNEYGISAAFSQNSSTACRLYFYNTTATTTYALPYVIAIGTY